MPTTVGTQRPPELSKLALWEWGRRRLGYGDYDDHVFEEPYQKWAGMQAHRLNLTMTKRRISQAEFMVAVEYCARHHKRIENAIWVFKHLAEAKAEAALVAQTTGLTADIEAAIAYEQTLASPMSPTWIERLSRARGPFRQEVLAEWRESQKQAQAR